MLSCANCGEKYLSPDGAELYEKNVQLQKENKELKEKIKSEKYIKENALQEATKYSMKCGEFRQTLEEIRNYANTLYNESLIDGSKLKLRSGMYRIKSKINEVLEDSEDVENE